MSSAGAISILHVDMDAFFAAVEQRDHPDLKGKPLLIGHDGPRGVVATASYEARRFGCHSAQPMSVAKRLCPHAIVLPVRGEAYHEASERMFAILDEFSPVVEPLSIDEAFLNLAGTERLLGPPEQVAAKIRARIAADLHLTASAGVAPNKFLAKLASDLDKPDGLTIIRPEDIDRILLPLPVTKIWGIGKATAASLEQWGIRTIADLRAKPLEWLEEHCGSEGQRFYNLARGLDVRSVTTDRESKSIGHEQTFEVDVAEVEEVRRVLLDQVEAVGARLRRGGLRARGVSVKIRFGTFQTINRSMTLSEPSDATDELWQAAKTLFDKWPFQPVRLIGMTAERLSEETQTPMTQLDLFADPQRQRRRDLDAIADQINERFGKRAIRRGGASG